MKDKNCTEMVKLARSGECLVDEKLHGQELEGNTLLQVTKTRTPNDLNRLTFTKKEPYSIIPLGIVNLLNENGRDRKNMNL